MFRFAKYKLYRTVLYHMTVKNNWVWAIYLFFSLVSVTIVLCFIYYLKSCSLCLQEVRVSTLFILNILLLSSGVVTGYKHLLLALQLFMFGLRNYYLLVSYLRRSLSSSRSVFPLKETLLIRWLWPLTYRQMQSQQASGGSAGNRGDSPVGGSGNRTTGEDVSTVSKLTSSEEPGGMIISAPKKSLLFARFLYFK